MQYQSTKVFRQPRPRQNTTPNPLGGHFAAVPNHGEAVTGGASAPSHHDCCGAARAVEQGSCFDARMYYTFCVRSSPRVATATRLARRSRELTNKRGCREAN